jgi:hypothetical protein
MQIEMRNEGIDMFDAARQCGVEMRGRCLLAPTQQPIISFRSLLSPEVETGNNLINCQHTYLIYQHKQSQSLEHQ